jgi:hypothetical protein
MTSKYFLISIIFFSCGTGIKVSKTEFNSISADYHGSFQNDPYKTIGKSYITRQKFPTLTLLNHFRISLNSDSVKLAFNESKHLVLTYQDSGITRSSVFDGKFSNKGYYEIIFHKKKTEIPPLIPIFYSHREIDRLRIALTKNNELVIDRKYVLDGNFLFVGGGASDRTQNFFAH